MKFHPHKVHFMIGRGLEDWWWWVCAVWGEEEKVGEYLGVEMQKNHMCPKDGGEYQRETPPAS